MSDPRLVQGQWHEEAAFIVGGGPSLRGFDWSLLKNKINVIVINRAFLDVPTAAVWFSEDLRVLELYGRRPEWRAFKGLKVFHALTPAFAARAREIDPTICVIERARQDKYWSRRFEDGLSLSSNSGVGAINLACLLGAARIYLLGFDCRGEGGSEANYHRDYEKASFDRTGDHQYDQFRSDFERWVEPHTRDRIVVNLAPADHWSAINCWPQWDRDSFLATGRPSKVQFLFKVEREIRVDFAESETGRGQEAAGP